MAESAQPIRVVLADDHAIVRNGIAHVLCERFLMVIAGEASDGIDLWAALTATAPDLLIADLIMPHFDPLSALQQIRSRFPELKILAVATQDVDVDVLLRAGIVDGCYLKEQALADLLVVVQSLLDGKRGWAEQAEMQIAQRSTVSGHGVDLTHRQREMLGFLHEGLSNLAIARQTGLHVKTVETHLTQLYRHLGVRSRLEAVAYLQCHADLLGDSTLRPAGANMRDERNVVLTRWLLGASSPSAQPAILIVDDNPRYRAKLRRIVSACCPEAAIDEASDNRQALQLAEARQPRLAFVNVIPGDECGIACARAIKARSPATRLVILNTERYFPHHRLARDAGVVAVLAKPDLTAATLYTLVDDVFHA